MFATGDIQEIVLYCNTKDDLNSDSDHIPIQTTLDFSAPTAPEQPRRPQWKKADWELVNATLTKNLLKLPEGDLEEAS